ncbi:magnesium chelatase [Euryarchaeota archaeon ex4484_178]|nr:MAG: magnesium chelatase [Euryarchaeota archaeon ex4484_178]
MNENMEKIIEEVKKVIVGKDEVLKQVLYTILAGGHILFEDNPGLAKTLVVKSFAQVLGCEFKRVQFTPDLLPSDITGAYVFDRRSGEFKLLKGPVFTNILLADEINRSPPKTQAALLEAMQEKQVTIEGETYKLEEPFVVIATQNPIEYEGTYPLPEAQLDRFLVKLSIGYPSKKDEIEILKRRISWKKDEIELNKIVSKEELLKLKEKVEDIYIDDDILDYIVRIVRATRDHVQVEVGASPRGSIAIMKLSRARAIVYGRDYVVPDDVKATARIALVHRIILKPEPWIRGVRPKDILEEVLKKVPVPKV